MGLRTLLLCLLLLFCLLHDSQSTPFVRRSHDPVSNISEERPSIDAGAIDSCIPIQSSTTCGLNYSVPESLAIIAAAIEMDIDLIDNNPALFRNDQCMDAAKEIACAQRFPRCEVQENGDVQVHLTSLNCQELLRSAKCTNSTVDKLLGSGFCELQNSTQEAAGCKSIEEHAAESERELQHCTQDLQRQVTPWMYQLMLYYDAKFEVITDTVLADYGETCFQHMANFTCQQVGQCSEDGQRVEFINTYEICENFINCFPTSHGEYLRQQYNCEHWPHEVSTPEPTLPATTPIITTRPGPSTWPTPPADIMQVEDGANTLSRLSIIILFIITSLIHLLL